MLSYGRALGQEMWLVQQRNATARMALFLTWLDLKVNVTEPINHCDIPDNMRCNVSQTDGELPSKAKVDKRAE